MIEFSLEEVNVPGLDSEHFALWLEQVIVDEGFKAGDVNLIFCSDEALLKMNVDFLQHDYYTDIITFDYSTETYIAGDLFISIDRVLENSSVEKVSFDEELHRVVYHGLLHLLGYNDKNQEQIRTMRSKENYYLTKLFHVKH